MLGGRTTHMQILLTIIARGSTQHLLAFIAPEFCRLLLTILTLQIE
jgi:hypothetical protein